MNGFGRLALMVFLVLSLGIIHPEYPGTLNFIAIILLGAGFVLAGGND